MHRLRWAGLALVILGLVGVVVGLPRILARPAPRLAVLGPSGTTGLSAPAGGPVAAAALSGPQIVTADRQDQSAPLRDLKLDPAIAAAQSTMSLENESLPLWNGLNLARPGAPDPVRQAAFAAATMPDPLLTFEGVTNLNGVYPPDTNGDIGIRHYMQWVNSSLAVYDRTGTRVFGPVAGNTLWAGFGGVCETTNYGDPIVQYDHLADRWMVSQFAVPGSTSGYHECVAVSVTDDPTGSWYRYDFRISLLKMNDYPHFGVWPDGYYMSINQFSGGTAWGGQGAVVFERSQMLQGQTARMVYFDLDPTQAAYTNLGGMLPADLDGPAPLPGTPNYFVQVDAAPAQLQLWAFHVDWVNPAASTFTQTAVIPVADFAPLCNGIQYMICVPQPGTSQKLASLADRLMYRLQYRNFGAYQTLVTNHSVDSGGVGGVRWYELRDSGAGWELHQQSTLAPADGVWRWMGSAALDHAGNLAVGYSAGDGTVTRPSIRYAGRLAADPLNSLPQGEVTMTVGSGVQTGTAGRWGDYSMLALDPTDDCTFWYTNEYVQITGTATWQTRVGAFRFPSCSPALEGAITGTVTADPGGIVIPGVQVQAASASGAGLALSDAQGVYTLTHLIPGTYTLTASALGYATVSVPDVVVTAGLTATLPLLLTPAPTLRLAGVAFSDLAGGNQDGVVDPGETIELTVGLTNTGLATAVALSGELAVQAGQAALTGASAAYPDAAPAAVVSNTTPFSVTVGPTQSCGEPLQLTLTAAYAISQTAAFSVSVPVGAAATAPVLLESFDGVVAPAFPEGWSTQVLAGTTAPWVLTTTTSASAPNNMFGSSPATITLKALVTPVFTPTLPSAQLTFRNSYVHENTFDGGVLEIKIGAAGVFTDILQAGGQFLKGGYTLSLSTQWKNPLAGRLAWTGSSAGYITTTVTLPPQATGQPVQLRWLIGTDSSVGSSGQHIDSLTLLDQGYRCAPLLAGSASAAAVVEAQSVTYTWTLTNPSTLPVPGLTLTDALPVGLTYLGSEPAGNWDGTAVVWPLGTLAAGETVTRTVTVMVDVGLPPGTWLSQQVVAAPDGGRLTRSLPVNVQVLDRLFLPWVMRAYTGAP